MLEFTFLLQPYKLHGQQWNNSYSFTRRITHPLILCRITGFQSRKEHPSTTESLHWLPSPGMVPGQKRARLFPGHWQKNEPHDGGVDLKRKKTHLAYLKYPKCRSSLKLPLRSNLLSGEKGFHCSPLYKLLFFPHSNGNTNSFTLINVFTLAELGYKLETIQQKQSSQKCQLRNAGAAF